MRFNELLQNIKKGYFFDYGSEGWGFDSLRGHKIISHLQIKCRWLFIFLHTSNRPEYSGGDLN